MKRLKEYYIRSTLASKIRLSYYLFLIPLLLFFLVVSLQIVNGNREYQDMIQSVLMASRFNLDFKKDFDYETYLLIVGNKSVEESGLDDLLTEAWQVVDGLKSLTDDKSSLKELDSVEQYLVNLRRYKDRIEENLQQEDKYEENIEIWENDVQIVTTLLREDFVAYTYSEVQKLQQSREVYTQYMKSLITVALIVLAVLVAVLTWLSYYIPRTITRPIKKLSEVTDIVAKGDLSVRSDIKGGPEVTALQDSMNSMIDRINDLLSQVTMEQVRLRKAEFSLLQSQINPHFLYNTLDAIIWLAEAGKREQVVGMVKSLSDFFRTSLNQGRDIIPLADELSHVRSYLEIQQVRYQDILSYRIDVPEQLYPYLIPKITIQPLVENALYHGIKNRRGGGTITITAEQASDWFDIMVSDDGAGMTPERLAQVQKTILTRSEDEDEIYGLYNVNERIRLHFDPDTETDEAEKNPDNPDKTPKQQPSYGISVDSSLEKGTTVRIRLPYRITEEEGGVNETI